MAFALLNRMMGRRDDSVRLEPLYAAIVAAARDKQPYLAGGVADSIDGRFEMLCLMMALVFRRIEGDGESGLSATVRLTELFVDDMEGQVRELGTGDVVVGKRVSKLVSALGGRIGAYRSALDGGAGLDEALDRNLYREAAPDAAGHQVMRDWITAKGQKLDDLNVPDIIAGRIA